MKDLFYKIDYNDYLIIKQYNPECPERKERFFLKFAKRILRIKFYVPFEMSSYGGSFIVYRSTKENLLEEYLEYVLSKSDFKAYDIEKGDKKFL